MTKFYRERELPSKIIVGKAYTFTTQLILQEAQKQGIGIRAIIDTEIIELTKGNKKKYFLQQTPVQLNSLLSEKIVGDKQITKKFLKKAGLKVANGYLIYKKDLTKDKEAVYKALSKPLVLKPVDGSHGDDVLVGIKSWSEFRAKSDQLFEKYRKIIVEEMLSGTEYRLTVTRNKLLAVTQRVPANVVGDGAKTLQELIDIKNEGRADTISKGNLVKIQIDQETEELLRQQKVKLSEVIKKDRVIQLKKVSNISAGGDSVDLTKKAHSSVKKVAVEAIRAIPDFYFGGLDLICENISEPIDQQEYAIIEINSSPGFSIAQIPAVGEGQPIAKEFLKLLFSN